MPDFGAPVATQANVDPTKTIGLLNGILGFKQAQQNLQSGAIGIQQQQAELQQTQQTAGQRAKLASFFQDWDPTEHMGDDGTLDLNSTFSDPKLRKAAGDQWPQIAQSMIGIKQGQLQAKGQLASLNSTLRDQFGTVIGRLREDPDVIAASQPNATDQQDGIARGKVATAISQFGAAGGPDAQRIASIYGGVAVHAPKGKLWDGINAIQLQALDAGAQAGRQAPSYLETPEGYRQINPQNGSQPAGAPTAAPPIPGAPAASAGSPGFIRKGLSPTQQPGYLGGVAAIPEDQQRYTEISKGTQPARSMISLADQVAALSDQVRTGKYSKTVTDYAATIGQHDPKIAARQLLDKYAAQLKVMGSTGAPTDNARAGVEQSLPNPETMTPEAVKEASRYIAGIGDLNLARSHLASSYVQGKGSANGLRAADDSLTSKYAPEDFAYRRMPTIDEQQRFLLNRFGNGLKITNEAAARAFVARQKEMGGGGR